jgi:hypothetical protein
VVLGHEDINTFETKEKIRKNKTPEQIERFRQLNLGKPLSPEIKEKLRQSKTLEQIE